MQYDHTKGYLTSYLGSQKEGGGGGRKGGGREGGGGEGEGEGLVLVVQFLRCPV
jgi:hypothetical protein